MELICVILSFGLGMILTPCVLKKFDNLKKEPKDEYKKPGNKHFLCYLLLTVSAAFCFSIVVKYFET